METVSENHALSAASTPRDDTLLSVRNLRTEFELRRWVFARAGFVRAVDGVSFELKRGEAIAIVGESGCGKSSLAKTILGLYRPAHGEVIFEGKNLASLSSRRSALVSVSGRLRAARSLRRAAAFYERATHPGGAADCQRRQ